MAGAGLLLVYRIPFFRGSLFDWAILLFLTTAGVAVWSSYDPEAAQAKFLVLFAAAVLYWAVSSQAISNFWVTTGVIAAWCVFIGGHFLLVHDWTELPADFSVLNDFGLRWAAIRPSFDLRPIHPNLAGGMLAALIPVQIVALIYAFRRGMETYALAFGGALIFSLAALLLTSSRAAWAALAFALVIGILWLSAGWVQSRYRLSQSGIFIVLALAAILAVVVAFDGPGQIFQAFNFIPGSSSAVSRLALFEEVLHLSPDYPFIGGGLTSFPGLYSEYILNSPFFIFGYAHNVYLDVLIEQGIFGLVFFLIIILGVTARLFIRILGSDHKSQRLSAVRWGAFMGLIVLLAHGLLDDPFYGMEGTALLFILPGLAIAATPGKPKTRHGAAISSRQKFLRAGLVGIGILAASAVLFFTISALVQSPPTILESNLGAIEMAKAGLA
ncbi:MAG: O-antigen ligase family protein, partial [Anaerolineales bacterium]|nr:O-antigen ligase family protein [Anaerolineales bacterium]